MTPDDIIVNYRHSPTYELGPYKIQPIVIPETFTISQGQLFSLTRHRISARCICHPQHNLHHQTKIFSYDPKDSVWGTCIKPIPAEHDLPVTPTPAPQTCSKERDTRDRLNTPLQQQRHTATGPVDTAQAARAVWDTGSDMDSATCESMGRAGRGDWLVCRLCVLVEGLKECEEVCVNGKEEWRKWWCLGRGDGNDALTWKRGRLEEKL